MKTRAIALALSFVAAAVAAVLATTVTASWTAPTAAFVGVVTVGACLVGFAELKDRSRGPLDDHKAVRVTHASGSGSVSIGGSNSGDITTAGPSREHGRP